MWDMRGDSLYALHPVLFSGLDSRSPDPWRRLLVQPASRTSSLSTVLLVPGTLLCEVHLLRTYLHTMLSTAAPGTPEGVVLTKSVLYDEYDEYLIAADKPVVILLDTRVHVHMYMPWYVFFVRCESCESHVQGGTYCRRALALRCVAVSSIECQALFSQLRRSLHVFMHQSNNETEH